MKKIIIVAIILITIAYSAYVYYRNNLDTSDHEINSLYKSDERIYNEFLDEKEKDMYNLLIDKSIKHQEKFTINLDDYDCKNYMACSNILNKAHEALTVDHPELMNYAGYSWKSEGTDFIIKLHYSYNLTYKDYYGDYKIDLILEEIEKATKNMTDKEKIIYVYDWMGEHYKYDYYFTYTTKNQSIYNVFIKKNAVCAGFAKASQVIFQRIGIQSYIVSGQNADDYHMWNIIFYNGKYYFFDSTIAVSYKTTSEHYYDGIRQDKMSTYSIKYHQWYPDIEEDNMFAE